MTKADFELIEKELNIILPKIYQTAIQNNQIADKKRYCNVYKSLLDTAIDVIAVNLELRRDGLKKKVWNNNLFVIGVGVGGCYFFLNLEEQESSKIYYISSKDKYYPEKIDKYIAFDNFNEFFTNRITLQSISGFGE